MRWLAISIWVLSLLLIGLALLLPHLVGGSIAGIRRYDFWREVLLSVPIDATVGMLIMMRRPHHRIGWLFAGIGLLGALQFFCGQYATSSLDLQRDVLPGAAIMAWISKQAQILVVTSLVLLVLLFPTGHLPSPRWRLVAWATALVFGSSLLIEGMRPGELFGFPSIDNLFGMEQLFAVGDKLMVVLAPLILVMVLSAIASLFVRLHYAQGIERQQLKWFVYIVSLSVAMLLGPGTLFPEYTSGVVGNLLWAVVAASPAVGAATAILKYRLYDIDVLINRTLVYGALTATLALIYVGSVFGLQRGLAPFIGPDSDVATIVSTLAIAALFNPLRRRIQAFIDRRFYRRKYDAAQVLAAFSMTARDEVDLDRLTNELLAVVEETLQPEHVSLWLREPEVK